MSLSNILEHVIILWLMVLAIGLCTFRPKLARRIFDNILLVAALWTFYYGYRFLMESNFIL